MSKTQIDKHYDVLIAQFLWVQFVLHEVDPHECFLLRNSLVFLSFYASFLGFKGSQGEENPWRF